jgi:hypothetical protein
LFADLPLPAAPGLDTLAQFAHGKILSKLVRWREKPPLSHASSDTS